MQSEALLHNGPHFDVLQSLDTNSRIPKPVYPQALATWIAVPVDVTNYAFVGLSPFPHAIAAVSSTNNVIDQQPICDKNRPMSVLHPLHGTQNTFTLSYS